MRSEPPADGWHFRRSAFGDAYDLWRDGREVESIHKRGATWTLVGDAARYGTRDEAMRAAEAGRHMG